MRNLPPVIYRQAFRTDAAGMAAVQAGRADHDEVDPLSTLEGIPTESQIAERLEQAENRGELDRWLVAQVGEQLVAYSQPGCWQERDGTWVHLILGWVLPEWRGQGIGSQMLQRMEELARTRTEMKHPGERAEFAANASSTEPESTALLADMGYWPAYTVLEMELDLGAAVIESILADGITIRPVQPDHYRRIADGVGLCYRDEYDQGRFADEFDPDWYAQHLAEPGQDPALWQVAWVGEEVVGQVLSRIEKRRAEVFEVSVHPSWRRKGLARALLTRAVLGLRKRELEIIRLHTVAEFKTRARDLYRSLGFRVIKEFPRYRKVVG